MTRTASTMLEIGTRAPDFSLRDVCSDQLVGLQDYADRPLLVIFSCNHCPYVLHILESLSRLANQAQSRGLGVVMINANDVDSYADDSPEKMILLSRRYGFEFPYLFDASQQTAIAFRAACTPDFFVFDKRHELVYRGQYDASRPGNEIVVTGSDLRGAIDAVLDGDAPPAGQLPSMGCNIKWRVENQPDYF